MTQNAESVADADCVWADVACPGCGNANRSARRGCRTCGGTGTVKKSLPNAIVARDVAHAYEPLEPLGWFPTFCCKVCRLAQSHPAHNDGQLPQ
jgi:hypothetical protein